jgi:Cellulase (glycosyl hydrolase family 5)
MEVTVQDDALLIHRPPAEVTRTARRLRDLGADRVRLTAGWSALAPSQRSVKRPAFDATKPDQYQAGPFRALDSAIKSAAATGLKVQVDLAFWAPRWAVARGVSRSSRQRWRPDAVEFGRFAEAVARRYNGDFADPTSKKGKRLPAVRLWTTWNEPNHPTFLLPQSERTRSGRWRDVVPHVYRAMHEAAYGAIKRVNPQNMVLVGGLSSRGAVRPGPTRNIPPLRFLREMACVDNRLRPLRDPACRDYHPIQADGFAYHPYSFEAPPSVPYGGPDTVHLADLDRLSALLDELHKRGRITNALALYLTEFGYESNPPDTGRGVPPEVQSRYLSQSALLAWRNPNTRMFAQFLLQDMADPKNYQTGLLYPDGRDKPALQAFKLPFWPEARESNGQSFVLAWGQVRPGSGPQSVALEAQRGDGSWHTIPSLPATSKGDGRSCPAEDDQFLTDESGFYLRLLPYQGFVAYRARWMRPDGGADYAPPVTVGLPSAT